MAHNDRNRMTRLGLFDLIEPPPGGVDLVRSVLDACDYPWQRIVPALRNDPDQAVVIRWVETAQGTTGTYKDASKEIHLAPDADGFVLAHEMGHMVDYCTLTDRQALLDELHTAKPQLGHFDHDHPDAGHTQERWWTSEPYVSRINEAFADAWVAAFCPSLFANVRFVHWTSDLARFRHLVLARPIMAFTDIEDHPLRADIEWAAAQGLVTGKPDGSFKPNDPLTRAQICAILHRQAQAG